MELRKFVVSEFLVGTGAIDLCGQFAAKFGAKKVLIVTDPGIIEAGWVKSVKSSLDALNINHITFSDVTANPKDYEAMSGAELFRKEDCDVIMAVGGGSPMDCAKGIGIVCSNNNHINTYEGVDEVKIPMPPLICIPTTAGTAADISQFAIISHTTDKRKIAIISKAVVPDIALIDPETTTTMTPELTASTGMDALVHAIEAYVSNASSPVTDLHALEAIRLINENLEKVMSEPMNMDFRNNLMLGSLYAGMAFSNASLGIVHAMAHSLGGLKDLPHGECNALLLEHCIEFNFSSATEKYVDIIKTLKIMPDAPEKPQELKKILVKYIQQLRRKLNIDYTLKEMGIVRSDLQQLAVNAYNDACLATNPCEASIEQIKSIYERTFE